MPEGAVAVLVLCSGSCPDVLSHAAVRARNSGVMLACCCAGDDEPDNPAPDLAKRAGAGGRALVALSGEGGLSISFGLGSG